MSREDDVFLGSLNRARRELNINHYPYCIHSDREGITRSKLINDYMLKSSGRFMLGLPYRSNTNSIAESKVRTVSEYLSASLRDSGMPIRYWADCIRCFSPHWNMQHDPRLDTNLNTIPKKIVFGRLGLVVLPPKMRGAKTDSRLLPRSYYCAFLGYDFMSSGGVWVLTRTASGHLKRVCVLERDIRWQDRYAYTTRQENLELIRSLCNEMLQTSADVPYENEDEEVEVEVAVPDEVPDLADDSSSPGGEAELICLSDDDISQPRPIIEFSSTDTDEERHHQQFQHAAPMKRLRQKFKKRSRQKLNSEVLVNKDERERFKSEMQERIKNEKVRFAQARKAKIESTYQAKFMRCAEILGPHLVSKKIRKQYNKKDRIKAMAAFFSMGMQNKEDLQEEARKILEDENDPSAQAFALIVPTRKALGEGAPGETKQERDEHITKWSESITGDKGEVKALLDEGVLELRPVSEVQSQDELLPSLLILTLKSPDQSGFRRHKARVVACGNFQRMGEDRTCYAPVIGRESWVPLLALLVGRGFACWQMDISTAYLQTSEEDGNPGKTGTYMRRPWGAE